MRSQFSDNLNLPIGRQCWIVRRVVAGCGLETRRRPRHITSWSTVLESIGIALQEKERVKVLKAAKPLEPSLNCLQIFLHLKQRLQKNLHLARISSLETFYRVNYKKHIPSSYTVFMPWILCSFFEKNSISCTDWKVEKCFGRNTKIIFATIVEPRGKTVLREKFKV